MTPPTRGRFSTGGYIRSLAVVAMVAGLASCGGDRPPVDPPPGMIDRDTFIEVYVDLRVAALRGNGEITRQDRERVLAEHGVTEQGLFEFAEWQSRDVAVMSTLWDSIDTILRTRQREESDSTPVPD